MSGRLGMTGAAVGYGVVSKSFIPGRGWIPATKVSRRELTALARGGRADAARKARAANQGANQEFKDHISALTDFTSQHGSYHSTKGSVRPRVLADEVIDDAAGPHIAAFASKLGGRRAPGVVYARNSATERTIRHEHAHVTPKRSAYRVYQIGVSPRRTMAEEGRADYTAGSHYKDFRGEGSAYAAAAANEKNRQKLVSRMGPERGKIYSRPNVSAYRNVQDRMLNAGTRQSGGRR